MIMLKKWTYLMYLKFNFVFVDVLYKFKSLEKLEAFLIAIS